MPTDDQGQVADPAEGAGVGTPPAHSQEQHGDPLDAIQDPSVRAEQKKIRAIYQRNKKTFDEEVPAPVTPQAPAAATKDELQLLVTNQAKDKVSAEIRDAWDELLKIPLGGYDVLSASSIAKNMEERMALHKARTPVKPVDPAAPFQTTTVAQGTGGSTPQPKPAKDSLLPTPPTDWYPKKS